MKRFGLLMAIVLAFTLVLSACAGTEYSETFQGAVSAESYESAEDAVKGFLEEEVSGKATQAKFIAYEKEAELTQKEIEDLPLGEYAEGLVSAEKGTVEYEETSETVASTSAETAGTSKRTLYILTYTDMFRFFVPPITSGETLTASYYDSTFLAEKYVNCTMEVTMTQTNGEETESSAVLAKVTESALYEKDTQMYEGDEQIFEGYAIESNGKIVWIGNDGEGFEHQFTEELTIKDFFERWFRQRFGNLDHTYFVKTDTGYALNGEKYLDFLKAQGYGGLSASASSAEYVINITDGRMSDVTMKIAAEGASYEMNIKFLDFGTTTIDVPAEVKALVPEE